jgi:hypothetical protein
MVHSTNKTTLINMGVAAILDSSWRVEPYVIAGNEVVLAAARCAIRTPLKAGEINSSRVPVGGIRIVPINRS